EDRVSKEDCVNAMIEMFSKTPEERAEMGRKGRDHVKKNHNFAEYGGRWYQLMKDVIDKNGSWETRKNYNSWELIEV
ncbi:MAG: glycosyltransferase, partial [Pseudomonadota bacterium]|nr:glycosyltransferase [Pseudomonadota bacterium]